MKGRAAVSDGKGSYEIADIEVSEELSGKEVLVEIKANGVCHTDYDAINWGRLILGHEGAGEVIAVGSEVKSVSAGDSVIVNWAIPCGQCFHCNRGEFIVCEGKNRVAPPAKTLHEGKPIGRCLSIGTMATHSIVKEEAVTKITIDIPYDSACLIGCGVMTGYGAVVNVAEMKPGETAVVIGVGGVGLNAIQGAKLMNASKVIAVDISSEHLEIAKKFGATDCILAKKEDQGLEEPIALVKELTEGRGTDYAFECSGVPHLSVVPPLRMVRPRGNAYLLSNIEHDVEHSMLHFTKDRSYMRPTYGWCHPQIDFPTILDLYAKGEFLLDEMVTQTYNLDDLPQAFDDMFAGKNARGVIVF